MKKLLSIIIFVALLLSGCAAPKPQKSALELQAIQVKEFETTHKAAFTAVMSVFQDLGYNIGTASIDTGLITAKSPTKQDFVPFIGHRMTYTKANAFVEQINGKQTKIRLSFVTSIHTSSGYGMQGEEDIPVDDPGSYQKAFSKIQQALFIRSNTN